VRRSVLRPPHPLLCCLSLDRKTQRRNPPMHPIQTDLEMPKRYESLMTTAFCYFRVRDYDFWRAGYVRAIKATPEVEAFKI